MTDQTAPSITPDPDRDGVILHLPEITYLDTQVWSVDIGLTGAGLAPLRTALAAPAAVPPPADHRAYLAKEGWTDLEGRDYCPGHPPEVSS